MTFGAMDTTNSTGGTCASWDPASILFYTIVGGAALYAASFYFLGEGIVEKGYGGRALKRAGHRIFG